MPAYANLTEVDKRAGAELNARKPGPGIDRDDWAEICKWFGLTLIVGSTGIYGGTCPFCKSAKNFYFWLDGLNDKRRCRCFNCNFKGEVINKSTPRKKVNHGDEF